MNIRESPWVNEFDSKHVIACVDIDQNLEISNTTDVFIKRM